MNVSINADVKQLNEVFYKYLKLMDLMFVESNPIPVKTALAAMGKVQEVFRSPMCSMEDENKFELIDELKKLKLI